MVSGHRALIRMASMNQKVRASHTIWPGSGPLKAQYFSAHALISKRTFSSIENYAISPIIAKLLLILIAIAAGVVVYAYVIGFVGNTTGSSGGNQSLISIDNFCASVNLQKCNSGADYSIVVRNVGTTAFTLSPTSAAQVYFTDVTGGGATASEQCTASGTVNPGSVYTCSSPTWPLGFTPNPGDTINVKVVNPDGGQAPATTKAIS